MQGGSGRPGASVHLRRHLLRSPPTGSPIHYMNEVVEGDWRWGQQRRGAGKGALIALIHLGSTSCWQPVCVSYSSGDSPNFQSQFSWGLSWKANAGEGKPSNFHVWKCFRIRGTLITVQCLKTKIKNQIFKILNRTFPPKKKMTLLIFRTIYYQIIFMITDSKDMIQPKLSPTGFTGGSYTHVSVPHTNQSDFKHLLLTFYSTSLPRHSGSPGSTLSSQPSWLSRYSNWLAWLPLCGSSSSKRRMASITEEVANSILQGRGCSSTGKAMGAKSLARSA